MAEAILNETEIRRRIASIPHWYHRIEIAPGIITPGINDSPGCLAQMDLPQNMNGLRVLDIGARDGFYSFECERRGAEVVAFDHARPEETGFLVAKELVGSGVDLIQDNIYSFTREKYGTFDIVLFIGVLYHLRDPLWAIDIIRRVCRGELFLETHVIDSYVLLPAGSATSLAEMNPALPEIPLMQFYPRDTLKHDYSNYWGPNMRCVETMLEEANFRVVSKKLNGERGVFRCTISTDSHLEHLSRVNRGLM